MAEDILLRAELSQDKLPMNKDDQRVICRLDIEPSEEYRVQHPAVASDICLVLDASGSMDKPFTAGGSLSKRQGVMEAANSILPHLDPQDTVSLVFYEAKAYNIATCLPGSRGEDIKKGIASLTRFIGNTNFEAALTEARAALKKGKNPSKRIIFLTDGNANRGDPKKVGTLVNDLSQAGVVVDCLGVGGDFNFHYMRTLSEPSNGRTILLQKPADANHMFGDLLLSAQKVIATNVFLTILMPKGIRDIEAYQSVPEMRYYGKRKPERDGQTRIEVNVQTLRQDRRTVFILKANLDPPTTGNIQLFANIRLDFDLPPRQSKGLQEACNVFVSFSDGSTPPEVDTSVEDAFYEVELSKLYEELMQVKDKDWKRGVAVLKEMLRRAEALGDKTRIQTYKALKSKLEKDHNLSNDDWNVAGSVSSVSTQAGQAELTPAGGGIW